MKTRLLLVLVVLLAVLSIAPAWADDGDDCAEDEQQETWTPRHRHEAWGDYYARKQRETENDRRR